MKAKGGDAEKIFDYIRRFARFVNGSRRDNYKAEIEKIQLCESVTLYCIQPICGSNTYIFDDSREFVILDTGYAIFKNEMFNIFKELFSDWESRKKRVFITHTDIDHCGLLPYLQDAEIIVNKKSAVCLELQASGLPDYRGKTELHLAYSRISCIISSYMPEHLGNLKILDGTDTQPHDNMLEIGMMNIGELEFIIYEGSGGHLDGEMIFVCQKAGVVFTGDIIINLDGFSKERAEFMAFAPYLMRGVNVDNKKVINTRACFVNKKCTKAPEMC
jgi:glyoxylase-like metal-dependent hydrolase (beta-lactamase superfamily II)